MTREFVYSVCSRVFTQPPMQINRFSTGLDNYVYHVTFSDADYVFRCGKHSYENTLHYLTQLQALEIPVARIITHGQDQGYFICYNLSTGTKSWATYTFPFQR